jgi:hypothetical protein
MQVTPVGSIEATFTDTANGSIRYSVDGLDGDKDDRPAGVLAG